MALGEVLARWLEAEQGRFALWLPVAAIAGDAAYFACRAEPPGWAAAGLLGLGGAAALLRRFAVVHAAGLAVALFAAGLGTAQIAAWRAPPWAALPRHAVRITGQVVEREALPDGVRLLLGHATIDGRVLGPRRLRLHAAAEAEAGTGAAPGAWIALRGMVSPPASPAYPGGRDLQRDAWFGRLAGYGYALGAVTVERPAAAGLLARLRDRIASRVQAALPGVRGAIAATLLTGLSAAVPAADRVAFRDAGLSHLLAIAGLHVGIVMGLALGGVRWLLLRSERLALHWPVRQIASVAALAAGLAYLALTGMHLPTLRSVAMAALVVLGLLAGRRAFSLRGWGLAVLLVIAVDPEQVTGPSFQLSFAAVLALIAGYEALRAPLRRLRGAGGRGGRLLHHAATLGLTSLLAGTASLPFIAYHFGSVQLYFVLANLIAVPLTALWILPAGLISLVLMPLGLDRLALLPMGWGIGLVLRLAHAVAGWPGATLAVPHLPLAAMLAMAVGLAWLCLWRSRLRLLAALPLLAGLMLAVAARPPDVLVAPDARLAGVRKDGRLSMRALRGGDAYVQASWEQYLGLPSHDLGAACGPQGCRIGLRAGAVRLGEADAPCDAVVMVAQAAGSPHCAGAVAIARGDIWRNGAAAVWLGPRPVVLTDRAERGRRKWVFLPPEQRRAAVTLPFAQEE